MGWPTRWSQLRNHHAYLKWRATRACRALSHRPRELLVLRATYANCWTPMNAIPVSVVLPLVFHEAVHTATVRGASGSTRVRATLPRQAELRCRPLASPTHFRRATADARAGISADRRHLDYPAVGGQDGTNLRRYLRRATGSVYFHRKAPLLGLAAQGISYKITPIFSTGLGDDRG